MEEQLIPIGFFVIFLGIVLVFIGITLTALKSKETRVEWGIGGFIGPIPFGAASREDILKMIIIISLVFFILFLFFGRTFIK